MGLSQITMTEYDSVIAVTQNAINESLALYLNALRKSVALYYNVDSDGNYTPAPDPSAADYIFTGTLDYALDQNGNPVNIVTLNTGQPQTVLYNITFSNASFQSTIAPQFDISQQAGAPPWLIAFSVNLALAEVQASAVPLSLQTAASGLPPGSFSVQQLFLDLNTASFDSFLNIDGLSSFAGSILSGIMRQYLSSLQQSGGVIFGYALRSAGSAPSPTFMPTALDFCVTPYTDPSGNHSNPGMDTLNYLIMTGNRPLPPQPPSGFGFNWVDDPTLQGALAIRGAIYWQFLLDQANAILPTICPVCSVKANASADLDDQGLSLDAGPGGQQFTPVNPPQSGMIGAFNYTATPASGNASAGATVFVSASLSYSSNASITLNGPQVSLNGSSVVAASATQVIGETSNTLTMPETTFPWSADLLLQMDPANNGQLNFAIQNANFNSDPTVTPVDQSNWDKFIQAVTGSYQSFAQDPGDIRESLSAQVTGSLPAAISRAMAGANGFVFPGGAVFLFQNPGFTATDDLAANITYMTPNS